MTLCLTMIVRNEASTLPRCLAAVRPLIDVWCIVDTGSTDETMKIILDELGELPGELYSRPWRNFGHNRTEAFDLAQRWLREHDYDLATSWCLTLDADHELENHSFDTSQLTADSYLIEQYDYATTYANLRIMRALLPWRSVGVTHELWVGPGNRDMLRTLRIHDHNDGGSRAEKFIRDEKLLRHGLIDEPNNERYMFYLAQTCESLGKKADVIEWYTKRTTAGGFEEERWMARVRLGRYLLKDGQTERGVAELLLAFQERPHRAEPLWSLANHYRWKGKNQLAYLFAARARAIPFPKDDILFIEHELYKSGGPVDEELSISSYYVGDARTGLKACEALMARADRDARSHQAECNMQWYIKPLEGARSSFEVPEAMRTFDGTLYECSNPSICGQIANIRLVNYTQVGGKHYTSRDADGRIRTQNVIQRADGGELALIDDSILANWNQNTNILGLEDIRLVEFQGRYWLTSTCCQVPGANGWPQVVLGRLSQDLGRVEHLVPIAYSECQQREKNWLLWPDGDRLRCIYALSPLTILDLDPDTGAVTKVTEFPAWTYPGRFRGSAGPVRLPDGRWLIVAHDVIYQESGNVYLHRLIVLDSNGSRMTIRMPFFLEHSGVEYCCGAAIRDGLLILSYGFEDRQARWIEVPLRAVHLESPRGAHVTTALESPSNAKPLLRPSSQLTV